MTIEFDPRKREKTLAERGLDFARADEVFAGPTLTWRDDRNDYARWIISVRTAKVIHANLRLPLCRSP